MRQYLLPFLVGVALVAVGIVTFQIGKARGYGQGYFDALNQPHEADTVWKERVVEVEKPVPVVQWRDREKLVYVPKDSLIYVHDTAFLAFPREFKQYKEETFEAQISGIDPTLDWINVNQKTAYITNTVVEKKRWSFGITAGPGVLYDGSLHGGVGIVAGVQYNF